MMRSIRRYLMVMVSLVLVTAFLTAMGVSYYEARHEVDELFDAELAQTARLLQSSFSRFGDAHLEHLEPVVASPQAKNAEATEALLDLADERTAFGHRYERKVLFQVRRGDTVLFQSARSSLHLQDAPRRGYSEVRVGDQLWYLFTLQEGGLSYTAGERADIRDELAEEIVASYMIPLLVCLPLLLGVVLWVLKRGLQPLRDLADNIRCRDENDLAPVSVTETSDEIRPLADALNHLFDQVARSLERERRFTATASHEMRTPISVLKINAQNALAATDPAQRQQYLLELNQGIDRASRLMEQLLTLNKLEQAELTYVSHTMDLVPLLQDEIAALYPLAQAKEVQIELDCAEGSLPAEVMPQLFSVVVRNLVENAIKYAPRQGRVLVSLQRESGRVRIDVEDSGPGVPEAMRELIFERFYRLPETTEQGAGLGLAIVQRVVDLLGGNISLSRSQRLGGLQATLWLQSSAAGSN
ncbi:MAG: ATP-binding protein [Pseudomonadota bacterium]|nr:ATP-binding protein [Pseudomonadota bacterium]